MNGSIQNVLFDLGVVLVHLRYEEALKRFIPLCESPRRRGSKEVFSLVERDPIVAAYEKGKVPFRELYRQVVKLTGFSASENVFSEIWKSIFSENTPMIAFGRRIAAQYPVYIVTNAGAAHVPYLFDYYPSLQFYTDYVASYQVGAMKPEAEFYERALRRFGLAAHSCLLIDDRPENVAGAAAAGISALLYTDVESACTELGQRLRL